MTSHQQSPVKVRVCIIHAVRKSTAIDSESAFSCTTMYADLCEVLLPGAWSLTSFRIRNWLRAPSNEAAGVIPSMACSRRSLKTTYGPNANRVTYVRSDDVVLFAP
jgi:hypothetical protein